MLELHRILAEFRDVESAVVGDSATTNGVAHARPVIVFDDAAYRLGKYTDGSLVRLRGVVCDVQDPELVVLAATEHDDHSTHAPVDVLTDVDAAPAFIERVPLKVALFPHRTEWAQRAYDAGIAPSPPVDSAASTAVCDSDAARIANKGTKRSSDAIGAGAGSETAAHADAAEPTRLPPTNAATAASAAPPTLGAHDAQPKKPKAEPVQSDAQAAAATDADATALFLQDVVTIYVYDGQYKDVGLSDFKVNEAFDFVGVLDLLVLGGTGAGNRTASESATLSTAELARLQIADCLDELTQQRHQRSGAVVHCCTATRVTSLHHLWPHASMSSAATNTAPQTNDARRELCASEWTRLRSSDTATDIAAMRQQAIDYIASAALDGDTLAAEYVVLCLLSRVYGRPEPATPLGNLSLNLVVGGSKGNDNAVKRIDAAVQSLVPVSATLDLALATLNTTPFVPRKDYATETMQTGSLQLPLGAALVVDELRLAAGQLNDVGVQNIAALQSLVAKMLLPYDFAFYSMDFPQDVAVVTISEGKSILPVTVAVSLAPAADVNADAEAPTSATAVDAALLPCLRVYFAVLRTLDVAIGSAMAEVAEQHYVACRKANHDVSLDDLHRWLRLARLVALSDGEDAVTQRAWDHMLALEAARLARLA